jgi:parallel beta-helix repeat protein
MVLVSTTSTQGDGTTSVPEHDFQTTQVFNPVIYISTNMGFETMGFPGDGTESNPFVIQDMRFSTLAYGISIVGTDVYFIIRNCTFQGGGTGILLILAENGRIENCSFSGEFTGVDLESVSNCQISNSHFLGVQNGVVLNDAVNCTIENVIVDLEYGISAINCEFSEGILISKCMIQDESPFSSEGIAVRNSANVEIEETTIQEVDFGIEITESNFIHVDNVSIDTRVFCISVIQSSVCTISNSSLNGGDFQIVSFDSYSCVISDCVFDAQSHSEIEIRNSEDFLIRNCTFIETILVIMGDTLAHWTHTVSNVTNEGKEIGYFRNLDTVSLNTSEYHQIFIINSENVDISNAFDDSPLFSLDVHYSESCDVENVSLIDSLYSWITIADSNQIQIINFNTTESLRGFQVHYCNDVIVSNANLVSTRLQFINSIRMNLESSFVDILFLVDSSTCSVSDSNLTILSLDSIHRCSFERLQIAYPVRIYGVYAANWEHSFSDVFVQGRAFGYFYNYHLIEIDADDFGQLYFALCSDVTIHSDQEQDLYKLDGIYCDGFTINDIVILNDDLAGISFLDSSGISFTRVVFTGRMAIEFEESNNVLIENCTFYDTDLGISGFTYYRIMSCNFTHSGIYFEDVINLEFKNNHVDLNFRGFSIVNPTVCDIENNTIFSSFSGIRVFSPYDCNITGNVIENGYYGLYLSDITNTTISYNQIYGGVAGINVSIGYYSIIKSNQVYFSQTGIYLRGFATGIVENNLLYGSIIHGLHLEESQILEVRLNMLIGNIGYGIFCDSANGCNFSGNFFQDNALGDAYEYGIGNDWNGNCWFNKQNATSVIIEGLSSNSDNETLQLVSYEIDVPLLTDAPDFELDYSNRSVEVSWIVWTISDASIELSHNGVILWEGDISEPTRITYVFENLTAGYHSVILSVLVNGSVHISDSVILKMMETSPFLITAIAGAGLVGVVIVIEYKRKRKADSEDATTDDVITPSDLLSD